MADYFTKINLQFQLPFILGNMIKLYALKEKRRSYKLQRHIPAQIEKYIDYALYRWKEMLIHIDKLKSKPELERNIHKIF